MDETWPMRLFNKSILKQTKYKKIIRALGPSKGRHILEIGSDNGVFSYLFRKQGGSWKSADLDDRSVNATRELVKTDVYRLADGEPLPFADNEFDCVVLVDIIEHLNDDTGFMREIFRILKPQSPIIVNAPNLKKDSLLTKVRNLMGMSDAQHGHVRPGYTYEDLRRLLGEEFTVETYETYTKFFSKLMDTLVVIAISALKRNKPEKSTGRGILMTGDDMKSYRAMFTAYSIAYPFLWLVSSLDYLLFFRSGYMFIATGHSRKTGAVADRRAGHVTIYRNTDPGPGVKGR